MALTLIGVGDARIMGGESSWLRVYECQPGSADYPTGGYVIKTTASTTTCNQALSDFQFVFGATILAEFYLTTAYLAKFCLPAASFMQASGVGPGSGAQAQPSQQINLVFYEAAGSTPSGTVSAPTITLQGGGAANAVQVANGNAAALTSAQAGGPFTGITGVQAPTFTGAAGSAAAFAEAGANTDLSGWSFFAMFWGY